MTAREVWLSDLIGRLVRDVDGRRVGRIEELEAEVVLRAGRSDYVVMAYHVGAYGLLESLAGSGLARAMARRLGDVVGYTRRRIPWSWMDLTDVQHPRLRRTRAELGAL
jgi:hypothetical protein